MEFNFVPFFKRRRDLFRKFPPLLDSGYFRYQCIECLLSAGVQFFLYTSTDSITGYTLSTKDFFPRGQGA
jgi:hypothetical protein